MAHAQRDRYGNIIDMKLRATLATVDNYMFNTRYEGSAKSGAVKIPVRDTEISGGAYNKATGIAPGTGTTTYLTVTIDQDYAVNEIIDGYDAAAVPDGIVAERLDSAGYTLAQVLDADAIATLEAEGTTSANTAASLVTTIYGNIVDEQEEMLKANVPLEGLNILVSPAMRALLLKDKDNFIKQGDLSQELVMTGAIGMIAGMPVYNSNRMAANTEFIIQHPDWCHRIDEWNVEPMLVDLNGSANFVGASAVKGRKAYKHKVSKAAAVRVKTFV